MTGFPRGRTLWMTEGTTLMVIALALVITGVLFLLRNAQVLSTEVLGVIWPIILIVLGAALLLERGDHRAGFACWPGCPCMTSRGRR